MRLTRIASSSSTLIENICVNTFNGFKSGLVTNDITDHFPFFIKNGDYFKTDKTPPKQIRYRLMNETTLYNLYQKLSMIDTTKIMNETDNNKALV